MKNPFTAKSIIFEAIKQKLQGTGIVKIVLIFNVETDKYSVMLQQADNKSMKVDIEQDDITKLKKLLINKIKAKIDKEFKKGYDCIILQVNIEKDSFDIFIQDLEKKVTKFEI